MASITESRGLGIGALSRRTGVNVETIRYYERVRLMRPPPRTRGGHRSYGPDDLDRLRFIRRARALGFGLEQIRALLSLSGAGSKSCNQARDIAATHLAEIRTKLDDLARLESVLADTITQCDSRCCDNPAPPCPVLEALGG